MNQTEFSNRHGPEWERLEGLVQELRSRRRPSPALRRSGRLDGFPELHRRVCSQLALARSRGYSPTLVDRLDRLVTGAHQHLHEARVGVGAAILDFIVRGMPRAVRREWRYVLVAAVTFVAPAVLILGVLRASPDLAYAVAESEMLADLEAMYDDTASRIGDQRESADDLLMFGYYIRNNIGVGFKSFAGGVLFGVGSLLVLGYNGAFFGMAVAHLGNVGLGERLYSFVIGHGAFELTAIVLAGAAGLKLGLALVAPGRQRRGAALRRSAHEGLALVWGAAAMLVVAAFLEAFWSSSTLVSSGTKYAVGTVLWVTVLGWLGSAWLRPASDDGA